LKKMKKTFFLRFSPFFLRKFIIGASCQRDPTPQTAQTTPKIRLLYPARRGETNFSNAVIHCFFKKMSFCGVKRGTIVTSVVTWKARELGNTKIHQNGQILDGNSELRVPPRAL